MKSVFRVGMILFVVLAVFCAGIIILIITSPQLKLVVSGFADGRTAKLENSFLWSRYAGITTKQTWATHPDPKKEKIVGINLTKRFRTGMPQKGVYESPDFSSQIDFSVQDTMMVYVWGNPKILENTTRNSGFNKYSMMVLERQMTGKTALDNFRLKTIGWLISQLDIWQIKLI